VLEHRSGSVDVVVARRFWFTAQSSVDTFLFSPIGADRGGMPAGALSGLAQSDLDPWQEAAKLVTFPEPE
jgi:hypothetical protein